MARSAYKNFLVVFAAQAVVLGTGIIKALVLPKILGIDGFAYWQVYVLYSGFVGFFSFGFNDGIYLLYAGKEYKSLPFRLLRPAFRIYIASLAVMAALVCLWATTNSDPSKGFAFFFVGIDLFLCCISGVYLSVMQITDRFPEYSFCSTLDKVLMLALIAVIALLFVDNYQVYVVADVITKVVVCIILVVKCKELLFGESASFVPGFQELVKTIKVGFSLLIANFMGILVVNMGRLIVEWFGDLNSFSYFSFGVSITNVILTFITAISLVAYPTLKNLPRSNFPFYFERIDSITIALIILGLVLFFPAAIFIYYVFPDYRPLLVFLNFLFVATALQGKMQILNDTFYKALRKERRLLVVNVECVVLFFVLGVVGYAILRETWWIAVATAFTLLLRCYLSEHEIRKSLKIANTKKMITEISFIALFILVTTFVSGIASIVCSGIIILLFAIWLIHRFRTQGSAIKEL